MPAPGVPDLLVLLALLVILLGPPLLARRSTVSIDGRSSRPPRGSRFDEADAWSPFDWLLVISVTLLGLLSVGLALSPR